MYRWYVKRVPKCVSQASERIPNAYQMRFTGFRTRSVVKRIPLKRVLHLHCKQRSRIDNSENYKLNSYYRIETHAKLNTGMWLQYEQLENSFRIDNDCTKSWSIITDKHIFINSLHKRNHCCKKIGFWVFWSWKELQANSQFTC